MKTINRLFALGAVSAFSISPCLAEADATTFSEYMELSEKALLNEDSHNAEIYEELAIMKREADSNPDYNWTAFNAKKAQLKDRKAKPFKKRAIEFFKSTCTSDETDVCYVIDFSASMKGKRVALLRKELTHSINSLPEDSQFSTFFFAGPVWQAGDDVRKVDGNKEHVVVINNGDLVEWKGKGAHRWTSNLDTAPAPWTLASVANKEAIAKKISKQELVWGTDWSSPLEAALNQSPLPKVIYFMTDGSCSTANASAKKISELAKEKGVRINTIAMMHPKAEKPMQYMAAVTGGDFVIVTKEGECELHEAGSVKTPELDHDHDANGKKTKRNKKKAKRKNK